MSNQSTTEPTLVITILYRELAVLATFLRYISNENKFAYNGNDNHDLSGCDKCFTSCHGFESTLRHLCTYQVREVFQATESVFTCILPELLCNRRQRTGFSQEYVARKRSSWVFIALIWSTSIIDHVIVEGILGCTYYYSDSAWGFVFKFGKDCDFVLYSTNTIKQFCMVGIIGSIDTLTLVKLRLTSRKFSDAQAAASRKADINFFKQALLQFLIWIVEMVCYFFVSNFFTHVFIKWILMNLAWLIMHSADGISLLAINQEFKKLFWSPMSVCKKPKRIDAIPVSTAVASRAHQTEHGFKIEFSHS
ncbi:unnamed protein product [Cylicocyclus nassatus]|uniref:7TM GPCR serpentine receptor class x (Srx) domain-containing protein n=1 Tax=Cylicocyclus nassatus TaxID=53992 RepID=A0AA36GEL7_CYLNA|nr:unnamed protein product [Cylicocyclus nassatus]